MKDKARENSEILIRHHYQNFKQYRKFVLINFWIPGMDISMFSNTPELATFGRKNLQKIAII